MIYLRLKSILAASVFALTANAALAQTAERFDGTLNAQWGDPRPGAPGGETRFNVTLPDGKTYPLIVSPADQGRAGQQRSCGYEPVVLLGGEERLPVLLGVGQIDEVLIQQPFVGGDAEKGDQLSAALGHDWSAHLSEL